jgi:hypothetical protein
VLFVAVLIAVSGLVGGFLMGAPSEVPPVYAAACQAANGVCSGGSDTTKTATLNVSHQTLGAVPVEPDDGETWTIKAYWNDNVAPPPCTERTETASVDVSWNGSSWVVSNKSTTDNIVDMRVCTTDVGCASGGGTHDWKYQLAVDITDPVLYHSIPFNLRRVEFTSSSMDDGYELDLGNCTLGDSVSPTSASFSQADTGPFECSFMCQDGAPSVTITYW